MRLSLVTILILSLLVALVSQVQASHMQHCNMMPGTSHDMGGQSAHAEHSSHTMAMHKEGQSAHDSGMKMNCCDTDCQCPANACHGSNVFLSLYGLSLPQPYFGPLSHMEFFPRAVEPELTYRPPIIA